MKSTLARALSVSVLSILTQTLAFAEDSKPRTIESTSGLEVVQGSVTTKEGILDYPKIDRLHIAIDAESDEEFSKKCEVSLTEATTKLQSEGSVIWSTHQSSKFWPEGATDVFGLWTNDCAVYYLTPETLSKSYVGPIFAQIDGKKFRNPWNDKETFTPKIATTIDSMVWGKNGEKEASRLVYHPEISFDPMEYSFAKPKVSGEIRLGSQFFVLSDSPDQTSWRSNVGTHPAYASAGLDEEPSSFNIGLFLPQDQPHCEEISKANESGAHLVMGLRGSYIETGKAQGYKQTGSVSVLIFDKPLTAKGYESKVWLTYEPTAEMSKTFFGNYYWYPAEKAKCSAVPLIEDSK